MKTDFFNVEPYKTKIEEVASSLSNLRIQREKEDCFKFGNIEDEEEFKEKVLEKLGFNLNTDFSVEDEEAEEERVKREWEEVEKIDFSALKRKFEEWLEKEIENYYESVCCEGGFTESFQEEIENLLEEKFNQLDEEEAEEEFFDEFLEEVEEELEENIDSENDNIYDGVMEGIDFESWAKEFFQNGKLNLFKIGGK